MSWIYILILLPLHPDFWFILYTNMLRFLIYMLDVSVCRRNTIGQTGQKCEAVMRFSALWQLCVSSYIFQQDISVSSSPLVQPKPACVFVGSHAALRLGDSNNNLPLWDLGSLRTTENPKRSYFGFPSAASGAEAAIRSLKISVLIPGSVPSFYTCTHSASTCAASAPQLGPSVDMFMTGFICCFRLKGVWICSFLSL